MKVEELKVGTQVRLRVTGKRFTIQHINYDRETFRFTGADDGYSGTMSFYWLSTLEVVTSPVSKPRPVCAKCGGPATLLFTSVSCDGACR